MKITDLHESEFLTNKDDIIVWMKKTFAGFHPTLLTIEINGLVYNGNLELFGNIGKLKVQFKEVTGYFNFTDALIVNLEGFPQSVGGSFSCYQTRITSLKGCPQKIGGNFDCTNIKISDPKEYRYALYCEIKGYFDSGYKKIDEIINTYSGSNSRKYWPAAINLLSRVKL